MYASAGSNGAGAETYAGPTDDSAQPSGSKNRVRRGRTLSPRVSHQLLRALVRHEVDGRSDSISQQVQSVASIQPRKASIADQASRCRHASPALQIHHWSSSRLRRRPGRHHLQRRRFPRLFARQLLIKLRQLKGTRNGRDDSSRRGARSAKAGHGAEGRIRARSIGNHQRTLAGHFVNRRIVGVLGLLVQAETDGADHGDGDERWRDAAPEGAQALGAVGIFDGVHEAGFVGLHARFGKVEWKRRKGAEDGGGGGADFGAVLLRKRLHLARGLEVEDASAIVAVS